MAPFGALAGKLLTLRRQVSFEATPRLCGLNLLEGGRRLAPLEEFSLSTPGFFTLAGSEWQQGEGNGTLLQYSCLENPMDGGAWWAAGHGVAKSQTRLTEQRHFHFSLSCIGEGNGNPLQCSC